MGMTEYRPSSLCHHIRQAQCRPERSRRVCGGRAIRPLLSQVSLLGVIGREGHRGRSQQATVVAELRLDHVGPAALVG